MEDKSESPGDMETFTLPTLDLLSDLDLSEFTGGPSLVDQPGSSQSGSTGCGGCNSLQQTMTSQRQQNEKTFLALKNKIISTGKLISRYQQVVKENRCKASMLGDYSSKLDKSQSECDRLSLQVQTLLDNMEPNKMALTETRVQRDDLQTQVNKLNERIRNMEELEASYLSRLAEAEGFVQRASDADTRCKELDDKLKTLTLDHKRAEDGRQLLERRLMTARRKSGGLYRRLKRALALVGQYEDSLDNKGLLAGPRADIRYGHLVPSDVDSDAVTSSDDDIMNVTEKAMRNLHRPRPRARTGASSTWVKNSSRNHVVDSEQNDGTTEAVVGDISDSDDYKSNDEMPTKPPSPPKKDPTAAQAAKLLEKLMKSPPNRKKKLEKTKRVDTMEAVDLSGVVSRAKNARDSRKGLSTASESEKSAAEKNLMGSPQKKKRGRPRKSPTESVIPKSSRSEDSQTEPESPLKGRNKLNTSFTKGTDLKTIGKESQEVMNISKETLETLSEDLDLSSEDESSKQKSEISKPVPETFKPKITTRSSKAKVKVSQPEITKPKLVPKILGSQNFSEKVLKSSQVIREIKENVAPGRLSSDLLVSSSDEESTTDTFTKKLTPRRTSRLRPATASTTQSQTRNSANFSSSSSAESESDSDSGSDIKSDIGSEKLLQKAKSLFCLPSLIPSLSPLPPSPICVQRLRRESPDFVPSYSKRRLGGVYSPKQGYDSDLVPRLESPLADSLPDNDDESNPNLERQITRSFDIRCSEDSMDPSDVTSDVTKDQGERLTQTPSSVSVDDGNTNDSNSKVFQPINFVVLKDYVPSDDSRGSNEGKTAEVGGAMVDINVEAMEADADSRQATLDRQSSVEKPPIETPAFACISEAKKRDECKIRDEICQTSCDGSYLPTLNLMERIQKDSNEDQTSPIDDDESVGTGLIDDVTTDRSLINDVTMDRSLTNDGTMDRSLTSDVTMDRSLMSDVTMVRPISAESDEIYLRSNEFLPFTSPRKRGESHLLGESGSEWTLIPGSSALIEEVSVASTPDAIRQITGSESRAGDFTVTPAEEAGTSPAENEESDSILGGKSAPEQFSGGEVVVEVAKGLDEIPEPKKDVIDPQTETEDSTKVEEVMGAVASTEQSSEATEETPKEEVTENAPEITHESNEEQQSEQPIVEPKFKGRQMRNHRAKMEEKTLDTKTTEAGAKKPTQKADMRSTIEKGGTDTDAVLEKSKVVPNEKKSGLELSISEVELAEKKSEVGSECTVIGIDGERYREVPSVKRTRRSRVAQPSESKQPSSDGKEQYKMVFEKLLSKTAFEQPVPSGLESVESSVVETEKSENLNELEKEKDSKQPESSTPGRKTRRTTRQTSIDDKSNDTDNPETKEKDAEKEKSESSQVARRGRKRSSLEAQIPQPEVTTRRRSTRNKDSESESLEIKTEPSSPVKSLSEMPDLSPVKRHTRRSSRVLEEPPELTISPTFESFDKLAESNQKSKVQKPPSESGSRTESPDDLILSPNKGRRVANRISSDDEDEQDFVVSARLKLASTTEEETSPVTARLVKNKVLIPESESSAATQKEAGGPTEGLVAVAMGTKDGQKPKTEALVEKSPPRRRTRSNTRSLPEAQKRTTRSSSSEKSASKGLLLEATDVQKAVSAVEPTAPVKSSKLEKSKLSKKKSVEVIEKRRTRNVSSEKAVLPSEPMKQPAKRVTRASFSNPKSIEFAESTSESDVTEGDMEADDNASSSDTEILGDLDTNVMDYGYDEDVSGIECSKTGISGSGAAIEEVTGSQAIMVTVPAVSAKDAVKQSTESEKTPKRESIVTKEEMEPDTLPVKSVAETLSKSALKSSTIATETSKTVAKAAEKRSTRRSTEVKSAVPQDSGKRVTRATFQNPKSAEFVDTTSESDEEISQAEPRLDQLNSQIFDSECEEAPPAGAIECSASSEIGAPPSKEATSRNITEKETKTILNPQTEEIIPNNPTTTRAETIETNPVAKSMGETVRSLRGKKTLEKPKLTPSVAAPSRTVLEPTDMSEKLSEKKRINVSAGKAEEAPVTPANTNVRTSKVTKASMKTSPEKPSIQTSPNKPVTLNKSLSRPSKHLRGLILTEKKKLHSSPSLDVVSLKETLRKRASGDLAGTSQETHQVSGQTTETFSPSLARQKAIEVMKKIQTEKAWREKVCKMDEILGMDGETYRNVPSAKGRRVGAVNKHATTTTNSTTTNQACSLIENVSESESVRKRRHTGQKRKKKEERGKPAVKSDTRAAHDGSLDYATSGWASAIKKKRLSNVDGGNKEATQVKHVVSQRPLLDYESLEPVVPVEAMTDAVGSIKESLHLVERLKPTEKKLVAENVGKTAKSIADKAAFSPVDVAQDNSSKSSLTPETTSEKVANLSVETDSENENLVMDFSEQESSVSMVTKETAVVMETETVPVAMEMKLSPLADREEKSVENTAGPLAVSAVKQEPSSVPIATRISQNVVVAKEQPKIKLVDYDSDDSEADSGSDTEEAAELVTEAATEDTVMNAAEDVAKDVTREVVQAPVQSLASRPASLNLRSLLAPRPRTMASPVYIPDLIADLPQSVIDVIRGSRYSVTSPLMTSSLSPIPGTSRDVMSPVTPLSPMLVLPAVTMLSPLPPSPVPDRTSSPGTEDVMTSSSPVPSAVTPLPPTPVLAGPAPAFTQEAPPSALSVPAHSRKNLSHSFEDESLHESDLPDQSMDFTPLDGMDQAHDVTAAIMTSSTPQPPASPGPDGGEDPLEETQEVLVMPGLSDTDTDDDDDQMTSQPPDDVIKVAPSKRLFETELAAAEPPHETKPNIAELNKRIMEMKKENDVKTASDDVTSSSLSEDFINPIAPDNITYLRSSHDVRKTATSDDVTNPPASGDVTEPLAADDVTNPSDDANDDVQASRKRKQKKRRLKEDAPQTEVLQKKAKDALHNYHKQVQAVQHALSLIRNHVASGPLDDHITLMADVINNCDVTVTPPVVAECIVQFLRRDEGRSLMLEKVSRLTLHPRLHLPHAPATPATPATPARPWLAHIELKLLLLLKRLKIHMPGCMACVRKQLVQGVLDSSIPDQQRAAMCRLLGSLCLEERCRQEVRAMLYRLVHLMVVTRRFHPLLLVALAASWPKILIKHRGSLPFGFVQVLDIIEVVVLRSINKTLADLGSALGRQDTPAHVVRERNIQIGELDQMKKILITLCLWSEEKVNKHVPELTVHKLLQQYEALLTAETCNPDSLLETDLAVRLLCANQGFQWSNTNFLSLIWALLDQYNQSQNQQLRDQQLPLLVHLMAVTGDVCLLAGTQDASVVVSEVFCRLIDAIFSKTPRPVPLVLQSAAAQCLLTVSPFSPAIVNNLLHSWPGWASCDLDPQLKVNYQAFRDCFNFTEVKVTDSQVKVTDSQVKVTDGQVTVTDSQVKVTDNRVKVTKPEPSQVRVKVEPSQ